MVRHILGGFERAAVLQKHGDARPPESVVAERLRQARVQAPLFHDAQHVPAGEQSTVTITTESRSYMLTPSGRVFIRAPKTKAKPVRVVVVPEVEMPLPGVRVVVKPESKF